MLWCVVSGCVAKNAPSAETPEMHFLQYFRDMAARGSRSESEQKRCKCEEKLQTINRCKKVRKKVGKRNPRLGNNRVLGPVGGRDNILDPFKPPEESADLAGDCNLAGDRHSAGDWHWIVIWQGIVNLAGNSYLAGDRIMPFTPQVCNSGTFLDCRQFFGIFDQYSFCKIISFLV